MAQSLQAIPSFSMSPLLSIKSILSFRGGKIFEDSDIAS